MDDIKIGDYCIGTGTYVNNAAANLGIDTSTATANVRSYISLDGLEVYTKKMKEMIDKKLEVVNERLKKLEDGGSAGKFGAVRGWMMCQ